MSTTLEAPPTPPGWHVPSGWELTAYGMSYGGIHALDAWVGLDDDDNVQVGLGPSFTDTQRGELDTLIEQLEGMRDYTRDNVLMGALAQYLAIPDPDYVYATLATGVTAKIENAEDPLWLMAIGVPSGGKTEALKLLDGVPEVERVNDMTLPGMMRVYRPPKQWTGLLTRFNNKIDGLLVVTDFSAMLGDNSRSGETKTDLFNALRDIYDGRYVRENGDGRGEWRGRLTVIAACTPAIDNFSSYTSALGDRFLYYRLPDTTDEERERMTDLVAERENVEQLRADALSVATEFVTDARARIAEGLELPEWFKKEIGALANLATRGRGSVPRESWGSRDICGVPSIEGPGRMVGQLRMLALGLVALRCPDDQVLRIVRHTAMSSMPPARHRVLAALVDSPETMSTSAVARVCDIDRKVAMRALEDWRALGVVESADGTRGSGDTPSIEWRIRADKARLVTDALPCSQKDTDN